jgi:hypothetical protein
MSENSQTNPKVLTEIETALVKLRQAKELTDAATEALIRAGAFIAWATGENRRLVRENERLRKDSPCSSTSSSD